MGRVRIVTVVGAALGAPLVVDAQVTFDVVDIGVLPDHQGSALVIQGQGGAQLINEAGQVAAVCRLNGPNPGSCDAPPELRGTAVRFTPVVGLEAVSDVGMGSPSSAQLISEGGHVFGVTRFNDWIIAGQDPGGLCFWQPQFFDEEIWGFSGPGGRAVIEPPPGPIEEPGVIGALSVDRRATADGSVLVDFIDDEGVLHTALYSAAGVWLDLRDVVPGGDLANTVFASQRADSGWLTGSIVDEGQPRMFRLAPGGASEVAPLSAFAGFPFVAPAARAIDEGGTVACDVGFDSGTGFRTHAAVWPAGSADVVDLHDDAFAMDSRGLEARGGRVLSAYTELGQVLNGTFVQWTPGGGAQVIQLDPAFDLLSEAWSLHAMNGAGAMIGWSRSLEFGEGAWLWTPVEGFQMVTNVTEPSGRMWLIDELLDINDQGQIAANATDPMLPAGENQRVLVLTIAGGCAADLTGDGEADVFDLLAYLNGWFQGDLAADLDGNMTVDVFDLLAYLDAWFAGC